MYADRLRVLSALYKSAERENALYNEIKSRNELEQYQLDLLTGLHAQLKGFDTAMTEKESQWRAGVLAAIEAEITNDLFFVYPLDGYRTVLTSRVSRGKIHIDARVYSAFAKEIPGKIRGTQGRLFQQVVSFAALIGVMTMLGVKTIYIDEAFSGASKANISKLNSLLQSLKDRGYNIIMIAQDTTLADGIESNRLLLSRSVDNKTVIQQKEVVL